MDVPMSTSTRGGPVLAQSCEGSESRDAAQTGRGKVRAVIDAHGAVIVTALLLAVIVVLFVLHPHVDLLEGAFGKAPTGPAGSGSASKDTSNLYHDVNTLATDARYILVPSVSLAGAVGAITWALGSRRGPGIVVGAVIAGVVGVGLTTIVQ
jgi:hypothetical protein